MRKLIAFSFAALPFSAAAQLYSDDFDVDHTANWAVNKGLNPAGSSANFFFDYSSVGIPTAPNSVGGTTRGLRMDANVTGGIFSGLSVSPLGQSFAGDYTLRVNMWLNFIGPAPVGGSGSTQCGGLGIGTNGTVAQWAGGTQNSLWFATTTDGNSSVDWRAYSSAAGTGYLPGSGVFAAGTSTNPDSRNNIHPYYAVLGGNSPPAAQAALFPTQTGNTNVGCVGFQWNEMVVNKTGNIVTWTVFNAQVPGGLLIATVDASTVSLSGGNILLNYFDINSTSSTSTTGMNFVLFDNVRVVPEPATLAALGVGLAAMLRRRRR